MSARSDGDDAEREFEEIFGPPLVASNTSPTYVHRGPYEDLIRSWVRVYPSWESYNASVSVDELRFWPPPPQPPLWDGRIGRGVENDIRDVAGLEDGPELVQLFVLPVGTDVHARSVHGDELVPCSLLACGLGWQPPVIRLADDTTLRDAKWVFADRPRSLTGALHMIRAFR